ncbi:aquaporin, glycerol transport activity [Monoraphidium neglectum]|uniref:Aquaporin, glycerol transport activity n=1 Tax=Monoraphidium neglectum TaxID=145388 RepID=A0A0D2JGF9_9CHLO|nr:aquaporin, glycerol transport activity [Monoraphidium neglectum]KIY98507.1 aquaporin, glycerol transport activity [Monoraphidium neglectum]|eukprot:XP_013897527.1 aquaporin, glycerol transport activity [Monoraphidium neglectum]
MYPNPGPIRRPAMLVDVTVLVELVAAYLFALLAGVSSDAAGIAAAFAATMFFAAFASGAHINPSVSIASALSGHLYWARALLYIVAQVLGSLAGTATLLGLVPGLHAGDAGYIACHGPSGDLSGTGLYVWEALLTFVFVFVLYGAVLHPPTYGPIAPLAAGLALWACLTTGGVFTGTSPLNPAITFASSLVFNCYWRYSWMYWLAQLTGAGVAAALAIFVFGKGPWLMDEGQRQEYFSGAYGRQSVGYQPLMSGEQRTAGAPQGSGMGGMA